MERKEQANPENTNSLSSSVEKGPEGDVIVDDYSAAVLIKKYKLSLDKVSSVPRAFHQALLTHLDSNPTCPISLRPATDPVTGFAAEGFSVLFQQLKGTYHAFIFDRECLNDWMRSNKTNPVTRSPVNLKDLFSLS